MNLNKLFFFLCWIVVSLFSCKTDDCENIGNIKVSDIPAYHTDNRGIDYCSMLEKALSGDISKLEEFLSLEIYESAGYDHGIVVSELVQYYGEEKFIALCRNLNHSQKQSIISYLEVGIEYNNTPNQSLDTTFPILHAKWSKN